MLSNLGFVTDSLYPRCLGRVPRGALLVVVIVTAACAPALPPREPARAVSPATVTGPDPAEPAAIVIEPAAPIRHVVTAGQTLWRIARAYHVDLHDLMVANDIVDPTNVAIGTELVVPGATALLDVPAFPHSIVPSVPTDAAVAGWVWPVVGELSSAFGVQRSRNRRHSGIDIRATAGAVVRASRAGTVVSSRSRNGYGRTIVLDHGDGHRTLYAHNERLLVAEGATVEQGQPIATVGRTGNATGAHCHFEVLQHGTPVDPIALLAPLEAAR
jgi:murein DD-endopeptidase MepM/ murein hydrolase activator NlpD